MGKQDIKKPENSGFFSRVYEVVARIPYGKVASYGQIARIIGSPRAARQVGWALGCCPSDLPWHRVLMADGSMGKAMHSDLQKALLEAENISFLPDGRADMISCRWDGL